MAISIYGSRGWPVQNPGKQVTRVFFLRSEVAVLILKNKEIKNYSMEKLDNLMGK